MSDERHKMSGGKLSICITRMWPEAVIAYLTERFDVVVNIYDRPMTQSELAGAMRNHDIVCPTVTDRMSAEVIRVESRRARLIANFGAGVDHIDLEAARREGIPVSNTPDVLTDATADLALMLMLMTSRRAGEGERELRAGQWTGWRPTHLVGQSLNGKRLGLVGFGRIGQATAAKARAALNMRVSYFGRHRVEPEVENRFDATFCDTLEQLVEESDVVSLHCPGTAANRYLINKGLLSRFKRGAILINTARGNIVDEAALACALKDGSLSAAGLDVFEHEPQVHPDLLDCSNTVLLPHLGSATREARTAMGMRVAENIEQFAAGVPLRNQVA